MLNFKFNKLPEAYRNALFTPEQLQQLDDIGNAGTLLHEDVNPSGSAKQGQRIAEGAEFLNSAGHAVMGSPEQLGLNVAYHAGQYGLGKLMHSPSFVDWLMRGRGFAPVEDAPITLGPSRRGSVMGGDPDSILHDVQRSGKKIGVLEAGIQGKNADVRWLGDDKLGNKLSGRLGPQGLSQLAREIVRLHPQVENISGIRSGGAMGDDLRAVNFPAPSASRELPSPSHRLIPAAVATGAMSSGWDWENNRPKD